MAKAMGGGKKRATGEQRRGVTSDTVVFAPSPAEPQPKFSPVSSWQEGET